uniref:Uncharacterized protein n=1 Tax=Parascaris equorum TaxID=6256 RepID=A0A914S1B8_PAREQ
MFLVGVPPLITLNARLFVTFRVPPSVCARLQAWNRSRGLSRAIPISTDPQMRCIFG